MQRYLKLETYVGKLLLSYLNTYVKLSENQFAMSLWEGDLILNQLELRCEALERLLPVPVALRSGRVHELRIRVPWTKLNSESIIISLHTVDCVLTLRNPNDCKHDQELIPSAQQDQSSSRPPGYLQSYINHLLANIRLVVQNLNVKFIQEDIMLSLSSSNLDCFPSTVDWKPTFYQNTQLSSYLLHRKLQISDMTLCLDHRGSRGFVESYEEPVAYRLTLCCLVELIYTQEWSQSAIATVSTINVYSQCLGLRFSPRQLHALSRLIEVFTAVHLRTFDWSRMKKYDSESVVLTNQEDSVASTQHSDSSMDSSTSQQSWSSWMFSFLPAILPSNQESSDSDEEETEGKSTLNPRQAAIELIKLVYEDAKLQSLHSSNSAFPSFSDEVDPSLFEVDPEIIKLKKKRRTIRHLCRSSHISPLFVVGIFIDNLTITLVVPGPITPKTSDGRGKLIHRANSSHPSLEIRLEVQDIAFQTTVHGAHFTSIQLGARCLSGYAVSVHSPSSHLAYVPNVEHPFRSESNASTDDLRNSTPDGQIHEFLRFGTSRPTTNPFPSTHTRKFFYSVLHYGSNEGKSEETEPIDLPVLDSQSYFAKYSDDSVLLQEYPAIWIDFVNNVESLSIGESYQSRESANLRILSSAVDLQICPLSLSHLGRLLNSRHLFPKYASCTMADSCELPSPTLNDIDQYVPFRVCRLAIGQFALTVRTTSKLDEPTECIRLTIGSIEWKSLIPMYPLELTRQLTQLKFTPDAIKRVNQLIMHDELWWNDVGAVRSKALPDDPKLLMLAFTRNRLLLSVIAAELFRVKGGLSSDHMEWFTLPTVSVHSWVLNASHLWQNHPLWTALPHSEYRIQTEDQCDLKLTPASLFNLVTLTYWAHSSFHAASLPTSLRLSTSDLDKPIPAAPLADSSTGQLCISLLGRIQLRYLSNPHVSLFQSSLGAGCFVRLLWPHSFHVVPILNTTDTCHTTGPDSTRRTFAGLSVQLPKNLADSSVPLVCHAYIAAFTLFASSELIDWLRIITKGKWPHTSPGSPDNGREEGIPERALSCNQSPECSSSVRSIGSESDFSGYPNNRTLSRSALFHSSDDSASFRWRQYCLTFYRVFEKCSLEILFSSIHVLVTKRSPTTSDGLLFGCSELRLSRHNPSDVHFAPGFPGIDWVLAVSLLPVLKHDPHLLGSFRETTQWELRATNLFLRLADQPLLNMSIAFNLSMHPEFHKNGVQLAALKSCLHVNVFHDNDERHPISSIPSLQDLLSAANLTIFLLEFFNVVKDCSDCFSGSLESQSAEVVQTRVHTSSTNLPARLSDTAHRSNPSLRTDGTFVFTPASQHYVTSSRPSVDLHVRFSVPCLSGRFAFPFSSFPGAFVRCTMNGIVAAWDFRDHRTWSVLNLDSFVAVLHCAEAYDIPLICPMESALRRFDSSTMSSVSLVSGLEKTVSQTDGSFTSGLSDSFSHEFTGLDHQCLCGRTQEPVCTDKALFHLEFNQYLIEPDVALSNWSSVDTVVSNGECSAIFRSYDFVLLPELVDRLTQLFSDVLKTWQSCSLSPSVSNPPPVRSSLPSSVQYICSVHPLRVFIPLLKEFDTASPQSDESPDTIAFCFENLELNYSEHGLHTLSACPEDDCSDKSFMAALRGFQCWATNFASALLPVEFSGQVTAEPSNNIHLPSPYADSQNPALFWNRGLLHADWSCLPHPALGFLLIHSADWLLSYKISSDALKQSVSLHANREMIIYVESSLLASLRCTAASRSQTDDSKSSTWPTSTFDSLFGSGSASVKTDVLIKIDHVRLVCWSPEASTVAQAVIDFHRPQLTMHLGPANLSDVMLFMLEDTQMDLCTFGRNARRSSTSPADWIPFTPVRSKHGDSAALVLLLPCYPLRLISQSHFRLLLTTTRESSDSRDPFLLLRIVRESVMLKNSPRGLESSIESSLGNFKLLINIERNLNVEFHPDVLEALHTISAALALSGNDVSVSKAPEKPIILNDMFWVATRFHTASLNTSPVKVSVSAGRDVGDRLSLELGPNSMDFRIRPHNRLPAYHLEFRVECPRFLLFVHHGELNASLIDSIPIRPVFLLWPRTSLTCAGTLCLLCCSHRSHNAYREVYCNDVHVSLCLNSGCHSDIPCHGPVFDFLRDLAAVYQMPCSEEPQSIQPAPPCEECTALQPLLCFDDLRRELLGYDNPSDGHECAHSGQDAACWPWLTEPDSLCALPLATHPFPRIGEVCFCDNLKHEYCSSIDAAPVTLTESVGSLEQHWIGLTWAYFEPRTPVRIRLIPTPFEPLTEAVTSENLEVSCYLQYWDHSASPSGQFHTYSTFTLRSGEVTNFVLAKQRSGRSFTCTNNFGDHISTILDELIQYNRDNAKLSVPKEKLIDLTNCLGPCCSDPQPLANVWRLLVDLRAHSVSDESSSSPSSDSPASHMTLVHISPLVFAGSVIVDSVQIDHHYRMQQKQLSLHCPSLMLSFIDQTHERTGGMELARTQLRKLSLRYSSSKPDASTSAMMPNIVMRFGECELSIANPNVANLLPLLRLRQTETTWARDMLDHRVHMSWHIADAHCFISVDRLIGLSKFNQTIAAQFSKCVLCPEAPHPKTGQWEVKNRSNYVLIMQQLGVEDAGHCGSALCDRANTSMPSPYRLTLQPGSKHTWRPFPCPGRMKSPVVADTIRLRFGFCVECSSQPIWSDAMDVIWPPCTSDLLVFNLNWAVSLENPPLVTPNLVVLIKMIELVGAPGCIIIHSDLIVRNLLPLPFQCCVSPTESDHSVCFNSSIVCLPQSPSEVFLSSTRRVEEEAKHTGSSVRLRYYQTNSPLVKVNTDSWSEAIVVSPPCLKPMQTNLCTSQRAIIEIPPIDSSMFTLYVVLTLEFFALGSSNFIVTLVTLSPMFEVVNQLPSSFRLCAQSLHLYSLNTSCITDSSSSAGSPWSQLIPAATTGSEQSAPNCLPEITCVPWSLFRSSNLLLTVILESGCSPISKPIYISADTVLIKLASAFLAKRFGNSTTVNSTRVGSSVQTRDVHLPRLDLTRPACHQSDRIPDSSCYSLQLVIYPTVRLFNASGLDLWCCFQADPASTEKASYHLHNREVITLPKNMTFMRLGYQSDGESHWSDTMLQLPDTVPEDESSCQDNSPEFVYVRVFSNQVESDGPRIKDVNVFPHKFLQQRQLLSKEHPVSLAFKAFGKVICLIVRLVEMRSDQCPPNYVIWIDSLVQVRMKHSLNQRVKPCALPTGYLSLDPDKMLEFNSFGSSLELHHGESKLPGWNVPSVFVTGGDGNADNLCLMLSLSSGGSESWSAPFILGTLDDLSKRSNDLSQIQLLSTPLSIDDSTTPLLAARLDATGSCYVVEIIEVPFCALGTPTILSIINRTPDNLLLSIHDPSLSAREKEVLVTWHQLFTDAPPVVHVDSGCYRWIPLEALQQLLHYDSAPGIVQLPLDITALEGCELHVRIQPRENSPTSTAVINLISFSESSSLNIPLSDLGHQGLMTSFTNSTSHGPLLIFSRHSALNISKKSPVSADSPSVTMSLMIDQLSVSLLTSQPSSMAMYSNKFSTTRRSQQVTSPMPPHDELLRLVLRKFGSVVKQNSHALVNWLDVQLSVDMIQIDTWSGNYDFPTVIRSSGSTVVLSRLEHFAFAPVPSGVISLFIYPPAFECCLEDRLLQDFLHLVSDYTRALSFRHSTCSITAFECSSKLYSFWCLQCLHISPFDMRLSLRVTRRLYFSCQDAPLWFSCFDLRSSLKQSTSCFILTSSVLFERMYAYYLTQALFRAGWVIGSLDILGNMTGLVRDLSSGLRELLCLQPIDYSKASEDSSLSPDPFSSTLLSVRMDDDGNAVLLDDHSQVRSWDTSKVPNLPSPALWSRVYGGLNSLSRHTVGGILRSLTGIAVSVARNLDHLSLDEQHKVFKELNLRKQPDGVIDGLQRGLSGFGLSLLSAIAGIADQPLQAVFKAVNASESAAPVDSASEGQGHVVVDALSGFGRGLVGALVKPVAGIADLVAHTGSGILHTSDLGRKVNSIQRLNGPYCVASEEQLQRHLSVDSMVFRLWADAASDIHSHEATYSSPSQWMTTAVRQHGDGTLSVLWIAGLTDKGLICSPSLNANTGEFLVTHVSTANIETQEEDDFKRISTGTNGISNCRILLPQCDKARLSLESKLECPPHRSITGISREVELSGTVGVLPCKGRLFRWQRIREYLLSNKSGGTIEL